MKSRLDHKNYCLVFFIFISILIFISACNNQSDLSGSDGDQEYETSTENDEEFEVTPPDGDIDYTEDDNYDFDLESAYESDGDDEMSEIIEESEEDLENSDDAENTEYINSIPLNGDIVFTEIMYNTSTSEQWVELLNISDKFLNLSGCTFSSGLQSDEISFNLEIAPEETILFAVLNVQNLPDGVDIAWNWPTAILLEDVNENNSFVRLTCAGEIIDYVNFSEDALPFDKIAEASLSLCPGFEDTDENDDLRNWHFATVQMSETAAGTPGTFNDECIAIDGDEDSDSFEMQENELQEEDEQQEEDGDEEIEDGDGDIEEYQESDADTDEMEEEIEYDEEINKDQPQRGEIVFTELMPYPMALPWSEGQWVEVYNPTEKSLQLSGCVFSSAKGSAVINQDLLLAPQEYAIFGIKRSQSYPMDVELDWIWGDFQLELESDQLDLTCGENAIDSVQYEENGMPFYWPFGCSISVCAGSEDSELNDNLDFWRASMEIMSNNDRATPGYENEGCKDFEDGDYDYDGIGVETDSESDYDVHDCHYVNPATFGGPDCGHMIDLGNGLEHEICTIVPEDDCHSYFMGEMTPHGIKTNAFPSGDIDATPRHIVHLTTFSMSRHPVTVAEYRQCMLSGECLEPDPDFCLVEGSPILAETNIWDDAKLNHPVVCVNRYNASQFCSWVGGTMVSEAQYEYASVGPMNNLTAERSFPWGEDTDQCHVNMWGEDPFPETSPVGFFDGGLKSREEGGWSFGPDYYQTCDDSSPFGIHDMNHNVSNLLADLPSLYQTWPNHLIDPVITNGPLQIFKRGSSWYHSEIRHAQNYLRNVYPEYLPLYTSTQSTGFRCSFPYSDTE